MPRPEQEERQHLLMRTEAFFGQKPPAFVFMFGLLFIAVVGVLDYRRKDGLIYYDHAETVIALRGRGIAAQVVEAALIAARAEGLKVVPRCPYVADWIQAHPDFQPLVAS